MTDENTIIEGTIKFREGKKWKSRWCVMRKLSPVADGSKTEASGRTRLMRRHNHLKDRPVLRVTLKALDYMYLLTQKALVFALILDSVHLLLYRDARARWAEVGASSAAGCEAALSLGRAALALGPLALQRQPHALALLGRDLHALLACESRDRLLAWLSKIQQFVGTSEQFSVVVERGAAGSLPAGPAALHVTRAALVLVGGSPPALLAHWDIQHLRRFGVVEGRFCVEGGARCGRAAGLHALRAERATRLHAAVAAAAARLAPPASARLDGGYSQRAESYRAGTSLSELQRAASAVRELETEEEDNPGGWMEGEWAERGEGDAVSLRGVGGMGSAAIARCASCMSKLGAAMSRSSTVALSPRTPATPFSPAWTMHETPMETNLDSNSRSISGSCRCIDRPPDRPPKPTRLELNLNRKPAMPSPAMKCICSRISNEQISRVGPYENYDVPKVPSSEVDGEYYDTPRRLRECLNEDIFKITKSSTPNALILKKSCGCLLKFGQKKTTPTIVDSEEVAPVTCPCRRVTDWAQRWVRPRTPRQTPALTAVKGDQSALYAKVDLSRKTRRKNTLSGDWGDILITPSDCGPSSIDSRAVEIDDGPLANYENLNFALSLEHYENAKDLLKRAGVTQAELDAISANLNPSKFNLRSGECVCTDCGLSRTTGDYLLMEPSPIDAGRPEPSRLLPAGYTPMSPIGGFTSQTLQHPTKNPMSRLLDEKSASNPTLCAAGPTSRSTVAIAEVHVRADDREGTVEYRKRSSSADSSRFLDDVKEFEGSQGSASSLETLRLRPTAGEAAVRAACRDSSSSNDSGVSSCSVRAADRPPRPPRRPPARRSRSSEPPPEEGRAPIPDKSSSAEAEVPVLELKPLRSAPARSSSSGASDMSDYLETLSLSSERSEPEPPRPASLLRVGVARQTSTLRPRSGKEYAPGRAASLPPPP